MSLAEFEGYWTHTFYEWLYLYPQSYVIEYDTDARQEHGGVYSPWDFFPSTMP